MGFGAGNWKQLKLKNELVKTSDYQVPLDKDHLYNTPQDIASLSKDNSNTVFLKMTSLAYVSTFTVRPVHYNMNKIAKVHS